MMMMMMMLALAISNTVSIYTCFFLLVSFVGCVSCVGRRRFHQRRFTSNSRNVNPASNTSIRVLCDGKCFAIIAKRIILRSHASVDSRVSKEGSKMKFVPLNYILAIISSIYSLNAKYCYSIDSNFCVSFKISASFSVHRSVKSSICLG